MKDRLESFLLLPFSAGCISESSIPVVPIQHSKRSKQITNSAPTGKHEDENKDEEEGCLDDEESLSGQNWKTTTLPRFQKLLKNFSQLFVSKDEVESEMGMEIGLPTNVKHVSHIGLDAYGGCTGSTFSKDGWNDVAQPQPQLQQEDLIQLHYYSFPLSQLDLAIRPQSSNTLP